MFPSRTHRLLYVPPKISISLRLQYKYLSQELLLCVHLNAILIESWCGGNCDLLIFQPIMKPCVSSSRDVVYLVNRLVNGWKVLCTNSVNIMSVSSSDGSWPFPFSTIIFLYRLKIGRNFHFQFQNL